MSVNFLDLNDIIVVVELFDGREVFVLINLGSTPTELRWRYIRVSPAKKFGRLVL